MEGKKGCYFGFATPRNQAAWLLALGLVVAGAALIGNGVKSVNGCSDAYQTCRTAYGPLSDVETDKCVPLLNACAKPGIAQYTAGAVLLACVVLPAGFFCCCAVRPDKQTPGIKNNSVSPSVAGGTKQSIDCEKQSTSQQVSAPAIARRAFGAALRPGGARSRSMPRDRMLWRL
jgi:hypothetical protein